MSNFKPTWLYLKRHNITGLLYFGKTIKDPEKYYGSGVYWTRHLDTHGYNVTTIWKKLFTCKEELTKYALDYSLKYSIVESKDYANLKPEDGLMGGDTGLSNEGREIIRSTSKARTHSEETKKKIREARKQQEHPMLGKTHSEETKKKIREARANQISGMLGKTHSEESKRKLSEANKGRGLGTKKGTKFSDEHRAKMSIAAKARHARRKLS